MSRILTIFAILLLLAGCGTEPVDKDKPDAGTEDAGVDMSPEGLNVSLALRENGAFVPLHNGGEIEIISGFQGGWHVEPYLRVADVEEQDLNGTVTFWVVQDSTRIAESGQQLFEPLFFQEEDGAFFFYTQPVVFMGNNSPENLTDTEATIFGDFQLEDGRSFDLETTVTLINETEEFEF